MDISSRKAFFFDRDGVVNYRMVGSYIQSPNDLAFINDFFPFFKNIKKKGYLAILVTNQQGIGKGIMSKEDFAKVSIHMQMTLKKKTGYLFDDIFYCPDLANSNSINRKPEPGMIFEAASKWYIDLKNSWLVGDRDSDIIAGKKAGLKTIFIGNLFRKGDVEPDYFFLNLYNAFEKLEL